MAKVNVKINSVIFLSGVVLSCLSYVLLNNFDSLTIAYMNALSGLTILV